jgi:hypothetical protein
VGGFPFKLVLLCVARGSTRGAPCASAWIRMQLQRTARAARRSDGSVAGTCGPVRRGQTESPHSPRGGSSGASEGRGRALVTRRWAAHDRVCDDASGSR